MKLEEGSFIPLYYQIKKKLLYQIKAGELKENDKLPSEMELAKEFKVSRPTIRKALDELAYAGYLRKIKGKGTFVSSPKLKENLSVFTSFAENAQAIGESPEIKTLSKKQVAADEEIAAQLGLSSGDELIEIVLLRLINGRPVNLKTSYYPVSLFRSFFDQLLDHTPYFNLMESYLIDKYDLFPLKYARTFEIVMATEFEEDLLEVSNGSPLILWEDIMYLSNGKPAELSRTLYRSDKYQFHLEQNIESALIVKEKNKEALIEH
ncbi:GntR family transcriptional regulator [Sporosarcina soli]|uniref:GntR family transcriptional regulator n=1 Tax=Sporosarcina soli TaxID=334736 RepID=A0ABW0TMW0_9BACL